MQRLGASGQLRVYGDGDRLDESPEVGSRVEEANERLELRRGLDADSVEVS